MSNRELVIDFSANGEVKAMHMDGFDLGFLGRKKVDRATEIKFDEGSQKWGLFLPISTGACLNLLIWTPVAQGQGFDTYETARDFEVAWLNVCLHKGEEAQSHWGGWALQAMRSVGRPLKVHEFFSAPEIYP